MVSALFPIDYNDDNDTMITFKSTKVRRTATAILRRKKKGGFSRSLHRLQPEKWRKW